MKTNLYMSVFTAFALGTLACGAIAQPPQTGTHPPMNRTHRMGGSFGNPMSRMGGAGQIIGNKSTKVYHLPGDKGNMPSEKNRVYFRSEREAMAAGYHAAGQKRSSTKGMSRMNGSMGHSNMGHRMPMNGRMNGSTTTPPGGTSH